MNSAPIWSWRSANCPGIAQVFQLYQIEERPNREVCEQLKISESNLWVMLHRARKQLREHLDGWWSAEPRKSFRSSSQFLNYPKPYPLC